MSIVPYNQQSVQKHGVIRPSRDNEFSQYGPGMEQLTDIVAGMYKDIKQIKKATTYDGAQELVDSHNKYIQDPHKYWKAHELDITGAGGKPDGIEEVFATDGKGNIKIINGFTLAKSHYPQRKAFYTKYPTPETRAEFAAKNGGMGGWKAFEDILNTVTFDNRTGQPVYKHSYGKIAGNHNEHEFAGLDTRQISARKFFRSIFNVIWNRKKAEYKQRFRGNAKQNKQDFLEFSREIFNSTYDDFILSYILQNEPYNTSLDNWKRLREQNPKEYARIARSADFRNTCIQRVGEVNTQPGHQAIIDAMDTEAEKAWVRVQQQRRQQL
jgi:hypothetical protein